MDYRPRWPLHSFWSWKKKFFPFILVTLSLSFKPKCSVLQNLTCPKVGNWNANKIILRPSGTAKSGDISVLRSDPKYTILRLLGLWVFSLLLPEKLFWDTVCFSSATFPTWVLQADKRKCSGLPSPLTPTRISVGTKALMVNISPGCSKGGSAWLPSHLFFHHEPF